MINPCNVCPTPEVLTTAQVEAEALLTNLDQEAREHLEAYFALPLLHARENTHPAEQQTGFTHQDEANHSTAELVSVIYSSIQTVRTETARAGNLACGTQPSDCPRLRHLQRAYTVMALRLHHS